MKSRRRFVIVAASALVAAGGGAAIAATEDDEGKKTESSILSDAAGRLDVQPDDLRSALSEAERAQVDQAVEDRRLTEEQAQHIKEHMQESGRVLGFPGGPGGPGGPHGPGGPGGPDGPGGPGGPVGPGVFDAIATELGISPEKLRARLMAGKSMAQVARANGKSLTDVKSAAKAAIEKQLAADVEAGRVTDEEADRIRDDLPFILQALVRGPRHRGRGGPPMGPPPPRF
jgi:hypothetical protein